MCVHFLLHHFYVLTKFTNLALVAMKSVFSLSLFVGSSIVTNIYSLSSASLLTKIDASSFHKNIYIYIRKIFINKLYDVLIYYFPWWRLKWHASYKIPIYMSTFIDQKVNTEVIKLQTIPHAFLWFICFHNWVGQWWENGRDQSQYTVQLLLMTILLSFQKSLICFNFQIPSFFNYYNLAWIALIF